VTSTNGQLVILDIEAETNDIVLEIPAHTVVDEVPKQCTDSVLEITNITVSVDEAGKDAEVLVDINYHLQQPSADFFVNILPETSKDFEQPQEALLSVLKKGSGSETIKLIYNPKNASPHFLYVMLVPERQSDYEDINPYLVDLRIFQFE
jgi:hypothetical protein